MDFQRVYRLQCGIQNYPWGRRVCDEPGPFLPHLLGFEPEPNTPYAELWIGAHPKLPARVRSDDGQERPLDELIAQEPKAILGVDYSSHKGGPRLPFLLKVLDCARPLSIQAHPDRTLARELHRKDPEHYPDDNHKPEIAIGLRNLTALCQFRRADEIAHDLSRLSALHPLSALPGPGITAGSGNWLPALYRKLFAMPRDQVGRILQALAAELAASGTVTEADEWFLRLTENYPDDRGALSVYFLNLIHVAPGEAVFLGPDEPHAYLEGTIVECMAASDNVVRAGLTAKYIDTDVLVDMLTYHQGPPVLETGEQDGPGITSYPVPVPDFDVQLLTAGGPASRCMQGNGSASLLLVLEGRARLRGPNFDLAAPRGSSWLWPAALRDLDIEFCEPDSRIVRATTGTTP